MTKNQSMQLLQELEALATKMRVHGRKESQGKSMTEREDLAKANMGALVAGSTVIAAKYGIPASEVASYLAQERARLFREAVITAALIPVVGLLIGGCMWVYFHSEGLMHSVCAVIGGVLLGVAFPAILLSLPALFWHMFRCSRARRYFERQPPNTALEPTATGPSVSEEFEI